MNCKVCSRKAIEKDLCVYHYKALTEVRDAYKVWKNAYRVLTWKEYIEKIRKNEYTGQWVRDILEIIGDET
jgi:hypothetical protein